MKEFVSLKTIAERTGYSHRTLMNRWPQILQGIRPRQLGANRKKLFYWEEIERLIEQPK